MISMGPVAMTLAARTTSHWPSPPCPNWSRMTVRPQGVDPVLADRPVLRLHLGGWAKSAAQGLFALITGEIPTDADTTTVTLLAILLLLVVLGITMVSRKITRGLEFANLVSIGIQLIFLLIVDLFIVPFSVWWDALRGLVTPALPPRAATPPCWAGWPGSPPSPRG